MAVTDISLCSNVCMLLGAGDISSFEDESDRAKICKSAYPPLKASLLSKYPWRFLMRKANLTRDAVDPINEWRYSYIIPGWALAGSPRTVFLSAGQRLGSNEYEIFGRRLYSDKELVVIDAVEEKSESDWPAFFQHAVSCALGAEIALAITDQQSIATAWHTKAFGSPSENGLGGAFGDAMTLDSQASGNIGVDADAFLDARSGSWSTSYDFQWPGPA